MWLCLVVSTKKTENFSSPKPVAGENPMQSTHSGGNDGGEGGGRGGEVSRGGLSRIRSAPATWIETLLEDDEEDDLKPNLCLTELLTGNSTGLTSLDTFEFPSSVEQGLYNHQNGFYRQNSSPADFLNGSGAATDGILSNFGIPANYDYLPPNVNISPASKRSREIEAQFSSQMVTFLRNNLFLFDLIFLLLSICMKLWSGSLSSGSD